DRIGRVYKKAVYREYTDATFTKLKPRGPGEEHLGLLGPVVRAEVGDTIKFVFKNNTRFPVSVHPHDVPYDKSSEGAPYADGSGIDGDRELFTMFTVFDENTSTYLDVNIKKYAGNPASVNPDDDGFIESNKMHSINGYSYGNLPGLTMRVGQRVRWYLIGQGTEVDLHTPHWHGNTVLINGMRTDVAELLPMSMKVADMVPDNAGTWLYHCHLHAP